MNQNVIASLTAVCFNSGFGWVVSGRAENNKQDNNKSYICIWKSGNVVASSYARYYDEGAEKYKKLISFNKFSILISDSQLDYGKNYFEISADGVIFDKFTINVEDNNFLEKSLFGLYGRTYQQQSKLDAFLQDPPCDVVCNMIMLRSGAVFDPTWYARVYPDIQSWIEENKATPYLHYLLFGREQGRLPCLPIHETWYAGRYDAIIRSMPGVWAKNALDHYYVAGGVFGFDPTPAFDEQTYLSINDDVAAVVAGRLLLSGYYHYVMYGAAEGRGASLNGRLPPLPPSELIQSSAFALLFRDDPREADAGRDWRRLWAQGATVGLEPSNFAEELYCANRPDVGAAVAAGQLASGAAHWAKYGLFEDIMGTAPRLAGYCENRYLAANPDIMGAILEGLSPSGYHHFLSYGYAEGRQGGLMSTAPAPRNIVACDILAHIARHGDWPMISIIMPVYQTPERWLRASVKSVLAQLYPFWELVMVDDASPDPRIGALLAEFAACDPRVRIARTPVNGGIAAASNAALASAQGSWVALLDHDDLLTEDALYEIACAVIKHNPDAVYSDEDKMSVDGRFYDATHKPGWSPDLLRATMYTGHLSCYRKTIVETVGGFRSAFDGTQDYDLALRVALVTDRFIHVPKILYHWVAIPGSTAEVLSAKSYAIERQKQALEEAISRSAAGSFKVVSHWSVGNWRVVYDPPSPPPLVSVIIPSAGRIGEICGHYVDLLKNCIMSLIGGGCYENIEIIVVHNGELNASTLRFLHSIHQVQEFNCQRSDFNFSDRVNLGVERARGDYILLLNDDIQAISPGFIRDMLGLASQPGVGVVGPRLLFANGTIQHVGIILTGGVPTHGLIGEHRLTPGPQGIGQLIHNAFAATAACLMTSRRLYREVGGFSLEFSLNYNDMDFCRKVREKGLRIVIDPGIELYHFESLSKAGTFNWELQRYAQVWGVEQDPYVNPNFSDRHPFYEISRSLDRQPEQTVEKQIMARIAAARRRPPVAENIRFSFFMSIYRQPVKFLQELEKTITNQSYRNFEWIIVSDGDHRPELLDWLRSVAVRDNVKVIISPENQGIMAGYGLAFQATSGDYVLPVDADDFLTLDALQVMAEHIYTHDYPAVLYSDEFKSNPQSQMFSPFHKPDFDWVLHSNICFTCHLCALRRDVGVAVSAYTDRLATWSHDWDTFTRVERAGYKIIHVPHLLYAWRINPGSTASLESNGKPAALLSQRHVLEQHLALTGLNNRFSIVENNLFPHSGIWRLQPKHLSSEKIAIVIAANDADPATTLSIAATLAGLDGPVVSVCVVTPSTDMAMMTRAQLEQLGVTQQIRFPVQVCAGFPAQTLAAACAEGGFVAFIQAGCAPERSGALGEMAGLLAGVDEAAIIGGRVLDPEDNVAWAGGFYGLGGFLATADYGRRADDGGYHGMVFCQRFVDGVSSAQWLARCDFLASVLDRLDVTVDPGRIAGALALWAWATDRRTLYTPFSLWRLNRQVNIQPLRPDEQFVTELGVALPEASRWFKVGPEAFERGT